MALGHAHLTIAPLQRTLRGDHLSLLTQSEHASKVNRFGSQGDVYDRAGVGTVVFCVGTVA